MRLTFEEGDHSNETAAIFEIAFPFRNDDRVFRVRGYVFGGSIQ